MKMKLIAGLMALGIGIVMPTAAQNYYLKISGDVSTHIADHASWEQGSTQNFESIEAYNLGLGNGDNGVGVMRFSRLAAGITFANHHKLNSTSEQVFARKLLVAGSNGINVLCEKTDSLGVMKSAVLLQYSLTGGLIDAYELPALPDGFNFVHIFDVVSASTISPPDSLNGRIRILGTASNEEGEVIIELIYNTTTHQYYVKQYKAAHLAPDEYKSVYYIRGYHYGRFMLGDLSFYGLGGHKNEPQAAFVYSENKYERYRFFSATGADLVSGVQMNASLGGSGSGLRIDMAFTDADGGITVQQKDGLTTLNWRRAYVFLGEGKFRLGWGRDGHYTKQAGDNMDYFMVNTIPRRTTPDGFASSLHYDATNGTMEWPKIYNLSGISTFEGIGFPNEVYDPPFDYTFIANRRELRNGFRLVTSNAATYHPACSETLELKEVVSSLKEETDELLTQTSGLFDALPVNMVTVPRIRVEVIKECLPEESHEAEGGSNLFAGQSTLTANPDGIRLVATGKTITSVAVLGIDGRVVVSVPNINSSTFDHRFANRLVPGIYVLKINYTDRSNEARKISIY